MGKIEQLPEIEWESLIDQAIGQEPHNYDAATRVAMAMLAQNIGLYNTVHNALIEKGVMASIRAHNDGKRRLLFRKPEDAIASPSRVAKARRGLLDYCLPQFGKDLREATREEVLAMEAMHRQLAEGNTRKANWFASIASRMDEEKTVGESMDDEVLRSLADDAGLTEV